MKKTKEFLNKLIVILIITLGIYLFTILLSYCSAASFQYNPSNILDNVTKDGNDILVPIIFNNSNETISVDKVKADFSKKNLTVKSISTTNIGTGTKITVNENSFVYQILIYGDANGDGKVNLIDAQRVILHKIKPSTNALKGIYLKAANVSNNNEQVNLIDAQRIILFKIKSQKIMLTTPTITPIDTTKPVITLTGANPAKVTIGKTYSDAGLYSATDNYDGNITSKVVKTSNVNTNKLGTYTITYNVTDNSGNKADTKTRTVIVEDAISSISIATNPTKNVYYLNDTLDVTGAKITVKYVSGATKQVAVTTSMVENAGKTFTTLGNNSFQVNYSENGITKQTTLTISVQLKPIEGITLQQTGRSNIDANNVIETSRPFVLGTLVEQNAGADRTKLTQDQVQITVTPNNLSIVAEANENGNILLKGNTTQIGTYTVEVSVKNNTTAKPLVYQIQAVKNEVIASIALETIQDQEIHQNSFAVVQKKIIVKNQNGEELEINASQLTVKASHNLIVTKLKADKALFLEGEDDIVKYLQLATNSAQEENATIQLNVNDTMVESKEQKFKIGAAGVLAEIAIDATGITLDLNSNTYTALPIVAKNQYGETMELKAISVTQTLPIGKPLENNTVYFISPKVSVIIQGKLLAQKDDGLEINCYNKNGQKVSSNVSFEEIGITAITAIDEEISLNVTELNHSILEIRYLDNQGNEKSTSVTIQLKS